jgi:hypothetical protein
MIALSKNFTPVAKSGLFAESVISKKYIIRIISILKKKMP